MEFYVGFLERLMDALQLERANLVGISLGGGVALGFAFRSPRRVEKLVLVDSYGLGDEVPWGRLGYLLVHAPLIDDLTYVLLRRSRRMVRWSLYNVVHDRRVVTDEMVEEAYRLINRPGAERAFHSFQSSEVGWNGLRTSLVDRLHEIKAPVLIIHGANDALFRSPGLTERANVSPTPSCTYFPTAGTCRHASIQRSSTGLLYRSSKPVEGLGKRAAGYTLFDVSEWVSRPLAPTDLAGGVHIQGCGRPRDLRRQGEEHPHACRQLLHQVG